MKHIIFDPLQPKLYVDIIIVYPGKDTSS